MITYVYVDEDNIINGHGSTYSEGMVELDVPENDDFFDNPLSYKLIDGELIKMTEEETNAIFNKPIPPTEMELLQKEVDQLRDEKRNSDLALLELSEFLMSGGI